MRERPPATALGRAVAAQTAPPPNRFAQAISGARVLHPFVIPRLDLPAVMTLVPHYRSQAIDAAVADEMRRLKLEASVTNERNFESEKACRMLAEAVLDPEAVARNEYIPLGSVSDWGQLDDDVIADVWRLFLDLRFALDPIECPITRDDEEVIWEALKKKNPQLLRFCGVRRLSSFMLSMGDRLASLAPLPSMPSESSPDS